LRGVVVKKKKREKWKRMTSGRERLLKVKKTTVTLCVGENPRGLHAGKQTRDPKMKNYLLGQGTTIGGGGVGGRRRRPEVREGGKSSGGG